MPCTRNWILGTNDHNRNHIVTVAISGERTWFRVPDLWHFTSELPRTEISLDEFDLDTDVWFCGHEQPTLRAIGSHFHRLSAIDSIDPILLLEHPAVRPAVWGRGAVLDGFHRIVLAYARQQRFIPAKILNVLPTALALSLHEVNSLRTAGLIP